MKRFNKTGRGKGFTLIEIMIVVLIIGILLSVAVPNFVNARNTSRTRACVANLKQIDSAKEQWAMSTNQASGATPLTTDITPFIKGAALPACPAGGTYTPNALGTNPVCSTGGTHVLP